MYPLPKNISIHDLKPSKQENIGEATEQLGQTISSGVWSSPKDIDHISMRKNEILAAHCRQLDCLRREIDKLELALNLLRT